MALQVWLPLTKDLRQQGLAAEYSVNTSTAVLDNNGKLGKCYTFSTTTGNGILLKGNVATFMNTYINNHSWSMGAWVKTSITGSTPVICLTYGLRMFAGSNTSISLYNSSRTVSCASSVGTGDNQWHHIVATYNVDTNAIKIYVDGINTGNATYTSGYTYSSSWTNGLFIGRDPNNSTANSSYFYQGSMNDIRVYDHCLSPMEVKELSKGLVLHYPLNHQNFGSTNLLKNGFGELDRVNWSNSNVYTDVPSGHSEIIKSYRDNESVEFIPLFRNSTYKFTGWVKATSSSGNSYPSLKPYDADKLFISTYHCREGFNLNTMTTLKQQLNPGDTKIYVNDLSTWNANSGHHYDVAAIFSYTDGQGYTWPDGIYTRNCPAFATGTEAKTNLDKTNNIITLLSAYTGPTMPVGTKLCASTYGSTYFYPWGGINNSSISDWTYKEGTFSSENVRMECAKYIRVYAYSTCYQAGMTLTNLTAEELTATTEYDCSGYCNNGTKVGTFTYTSDTPKYTVSTQFNSTSTKIQLPVLDFSGMANSYTFAWWQYNVSTGNMPWGFSNGNRLNCYHTSPLCWNTGDGSSNQFKDGSTTIAPASVQNAWHHMVVTGDGTNTKLYIDGVYKGTAITYKALTGTQIWISGWDSGTSYTFNGSKECDFRIYATALSADDVKSLYQNCATIDSDGTIRGQIRS